ncbi:circumsporozoite protein-like [Sparus aurata]|uniref:circumsporozoite protein-like n=1 Tax=Sparus aurata TaxID=8175 RepID=UPI0011C154A7|nr:circumsporozoite protein-like [Sparus aurata]
MEKFNLKRENWVHTHQKNRTASHIQDEAYILLEKLQALGVRAILFLSKPAKRPNAWVSEVLAPCCQLTETSSTCLQRMKDLYDVVIQGWTPLDPAGPPMAPAAPAGPLLAPAALAGPPLAPAALAGPPVAPTAPAGPPLAPAAPAGPPVAPTAPAGPPVAPAAPAGPPVAPAAPAGPPLAPAAPAGPPLAPAAPAGPPVAPAAPAGPPVAPTAPAGPPLAPAAPAGPLLGLLKRPHSPGGFPAASPGCFEKECPHTVTGSQDFYPVKRVVKYKVVKGQMMKQVEWEPCQLCGKKWPLEWVADQDTC